MKFLTLFAIAFSFGAMAQDQLKCSFKIFDNETSHEELEESKIELEWQLTDGQEVSREVQIVKLAIDPESDDSYKHKVAIFENDQAAGRFLGRSDIEYRASAFDVLDISITKQGRTVFVDMNTQTYDFDLDLSGDVSRYQSSIYTQTAFPDKRRRGPLGFLGVGEKEDVVQIRQIPIAFSCQKMANYMIITGDSSEEFEFEQAAQEESDGASAQAQ